VGDIIEFPTPKHNQELPVSGEVRKSRPGIRGPSREELLAQGGEGYEQLGAWKSRSIPDEDRISMAKNMDAILNELRIKPKDLNWQARWKGDREAFNRDLSRMRYPADAKPGRRLMGFNTRWIDLLKMLSEVCEKRGENLTLNGLAERLTRGTRFHPVKQAQTLEEKQLYKLKLWANEVDERTGLLRTFKQLSVLRAEYFRVHLREYDETNVDASELHAVHLRPAEYFTDIPEDIATLFSRELGSYTEEDWRQFFQRLPEESVYQFTEYRRDIENWRANFDPDKALFVNDLGVYLPLHIWACGDFRYLPRFYLGRLDFDGRRLLRYYTKDVFPNGTEDPLLGTTKDDSSCYNFSGWAYLVLYPTPELTRLIPYLLHFDEEGSFCIPLTEAILGDDHWLYFPPDATSTDRPSSSLLARIEEAAQMTNAGWFDTATDLMKHPYFLWQANRAANIDEELARMTRPNRREDNSKKEVDHL
jgi:hypothetical protein